MNVNQAFSHMEKRIGLKMDIGAGFACDAQNNKIDSLNLYRLGFWTNIGYTGALFNNKSYASVIFLARFFNYTEKYRTIFELFSMLDSSNTSKIKVFD